MENSKRIKLVFPCLYLPKYLPREDTGIVTLPSIT